MKSRKNINLFYLLFVLIMFAFGTAICLNPMVTRENMENMLQGEVHLEQPTPTPMVDTPSNSCPNLLIRSQNVLFLQNTNMPKSATNPMVFQNLDEYLLYLKSQRKQNIRCPVLFLQEETNTQGENVYRTMPSPFLKEEVIMAEDGSRDNPPYNQDQYAGFDPYGFNVGQLTNIDQIHQSTEKNNRVSDNPMDTNWGGTTFSQESVESGKYADREVGKPTLVPKVVEIYK